MAAKENDMISTVAELEACIGAPPLGVKMKVIDHLDDGAVGWIAQSPLAFVGVSAADGPRICTAGGKPGFARVADAHTLVLPLAALDDPAMAAKGAGVLFLAPGIGETLRANGRIVALTDGCVEIRIEECFVHCAKALLRSEFWSARELEAPAEPAGFLAQTRFLAIATMDAGGRIDISPKGDPAGLLRDYPGVGLVFAERPGNRLAFGYRNILEQPRIAALALVPGSNRIMQVYGQASLSTDETLRRAFAVADKTPKLAMVISAADVAMAESAALVQARVWAGLDPADLDPAAALVAHVKLNKATGVQAAMLRLAVNRGLVEQGLKENYRRDLY
jgi:predicted pyridoxine 5'-phosphate oxidase superfamily flavin-nucleotide-binding protein